MAYESVTPSGVTAQARVTASETGDGRSYTVTLKLNSFTMAIAGAAAEAVGYKIAELPAGAQHIEATYMSVALTGTGTVDADTPDVGIGTVIATGAVALLGGTPAFEDIVDGQTATDCAGTATVALQSPDDEWSVAGDVKSVFLNIADTWAGADTITVTGEVTINFVQLS